MIQRSILTAVFAAILVTAATACADSTAPRNDCQITAGEWGCTGH